MSFYPEMEGASFAQLVAWWQQSDLPEWMAAQIEDDFTWEDARSSLLSEIAFVLAESDEGRAFLKPYLYSEDVLQRRHALDALAQKDRIDEKTIAALLDAFHTDIPLLQMEALMSFHLIERFPLARSKLEAAMGSEDELTAAWAMACLSLAYPDEAEAILRQALTDPRPRLREMACDEAGDRDIRTLAERVATLRDDPDMHVRQAADTNYRILTDQDF